MGRYLDLDEQSHASTQLFDAISHLLPGLDLRRQAAVQEGL